MISVISVSLSGPLELELERGSCAGSSSSNFHPFNLLGVSRSTWRDSPACRLLCNRKKWRVPSSKFMYNLIAIIKYNIYFLNFPVTGAMRVLCKWSAIQFLKTFCILFNYNSNTIQRPDSMQYGATAVWVLARFQTQFSILYVLKMKN